MQIIALKAWRADKGLSVRGAAKRLGYSPSAVSRWERGDRRIDDGLVSDISKKTGIPRRVLRPDLAKMFGSADGDPPMSRGRRKKNDGSADHYG